jgi:hypothetical protein
MKGQIWSTDFAISLFIFIVASVVAFTIMTNTLQKDSYDDVRREAATAAELLASSGYPVYWTNNSLIRAGVTSDNALSLRKMQELSRTDVSALRSALRINDDFYIYFTNQSGETISIYGSCGVGTASVASTAQNGTLPAIAHVSGSHPVVDQADVAHYANDDFFNNLTSQDLLLVEGNLSSSISSAQIALHFATAAQRGITIVIIGNPGIPLLGMRINETNITNATMAFSMNTLVAGDQLEISGVQSMLDPPADLEVSEYVPIAVSGGKAYYATWLYRDARVWYFANSTGTKNGESLTLILGNVTRELVHHAQPSCSTYTPSAKQVAIYTRSAPYHDQLININVLVWRNS